MSSQGIVALKVFVPAKDYSVSSQFYQDLGFELAWQNDEVQEMRAGDYSFFLQNYYQQEWADNFMLQLMVEDLDLWWQVIVEQKLTVRYAGVKAKAPQDYPWGLREIHLIDPAGVLWHIAQVK